MRKEATILFNQPENILTDDLLLHVPENARASVTPLLKRLIGNLDTFEVLELRYAELKIVSSRILDMKYHISATDLRAFRKLLHMPQYILGRLIGVSRTSISYWENSRTTPHAQQRINLHAVVSNSVEGLSHVILKAEKAGIRR